MARPIFVGNTLTLHDIYKAPRISLARRLRFCKNEPSSSSMDRASFKPASSASRRCFRDSYVSGFAIQRPFSCVSYSKTAAASVLAVSLSDLSSANVFRKDVIYFVLYFTSPTVIHTSLVSQCNVLSAECRTLKRPLLPCQQCLCP